MRTRWWGRGGILIAALLAASCQAAGGEARSTNPPSAATAPAKAAAPRPEVVPPYTHEDAVKLYRAAKYKLAESMCLKAIKDIEKETGDKSPDLAPPLDDLATVYLRLARFADAKPLIERAESVLDKENPEQAFLLGRLAINKGWRLFSLGDKKGAEKVFIAGKDLILKVRKEDSLELAELYNNIGLLNDEPDSPGENVSRRRVSQARLNLLKGWDMRKKLAGPESPEAQESLNNLGMFQLYHGEGEDSAETALGTIRKALEVSEKVYGTDHPETAVAHANLALALRLTEDDAGAQEQLKIALPITEKHLGKNHPDRAYELEILGQIEQNQGNPKEAETAFLEAVRIYEVTYGENHPNVAGPLGNLRDLYEETNEPGKGKAIQKRIEKLRGREI